MHVMVGLFAEGRKNVGVLVALKNSARNCIRTRSRTVMFFIAGLADVLFRFPRLRPGVGPTQAAAELEELPRVGAARHPVLRWTPESGAGSR